MRELIGHWSLDTPPEVVAAQMVAASGGRLSPKDLRALAIAVLVQESGWDQADGGVLIDPEGKRHWVVARTLKPGARAASFSLGDRDWDFLAAVFIDRESYEVFGWMGVPRTWVDKALHPKQTSVRLTWDGARGA